METQIIAPITSTSKGAATWYLAIHEPTQPKQKMVYVYRVRSFKLRRTAYMASDIPPEDLLEHVIQKEKRWRDYDECNVLYKLYVTEGEEETTINIARKIIEKLSEKLSEEFGDEKAPEEFCKIDYKKKY